MDHRRFDTGQLMARGILNVPVPETDIPEDRESVEYDSEEGWRDISTEAEIREAVEAGKVVRSPNYYGIPNLWKEGESYRGTLLQYRNVTEAPAFADLDDAVEWFVDRFYATDG